MARKPSQISALAELRGAIAKKRKSVRAAADSAQARHDPSTAHADSFSVLNPWLIGCADCEREEALLADHERLRKKHSSATYDLADAAEHAHAKRLRGQQASARLSKAKSDQKVQIVLKYCRDHKLSPTKPKVSEKIAAALSMSPRTVSRALKIIKMK